MDGDAFEIACAVRADRSTVPFIQLLKQLDDMVWDDPAADELPDEYQATIRSRLLAEIEYLAEYGEPAKNYNHLKDGIWELKVSTLRVTFYDTPGDGTYTPKTGESQGYQRWKPPVFPDNFDEYVRLGHYFGKRSQKTDNRDIITALTIREEDLNHD